MIDLSYALTSAVVGIALICGMILGYIAKEELKPGRKYLELFQGAMLAFIIFFLVFPYFSITTAAAIMVVVMVIAGRLVEKKDADYLIYLALSIALFASTKSFFVLISSLIFLYSLPTGSLFVLKKSCKSSVVYLSLIFILVSNILFMIF
jgi:hypothetical protein